MALPLEDYAMIGDCQTAALIGRDGSLDWLCFPNFDSGACFAALLGSEENGRWLLAPVETPTKVTRRYRGDTLILETDYETSEGKVTVVDCMPPRTGEPDLVRMVIGREGNVRMRLELVIRFDYGSIVPWVRKVDQNLLAVAGPDSLFLQSPVELQGKNMHTTAEFTVTRDEELPFVLVWYPSHQPAPEPVNAQDAIASTEDFWLEWSKRCTYQGPWRDAVMRSVITLKALTFSPTGGIVAAATTSLPEQLGGVRNWDYRFCWLRDATSTLYSLFTAGYPEEAKDWRDWLLRAVAGDPNRLQIMYGLFGERRLTELELPWLPGYEGSKPVRIGNAAAEQFQLDVYGEVLDVLHQCRRKKFIDPQSTWPFECALLRFLEAAWQRPDEGIWEVRGPRRHFTHSKVMAWVAFDRAVKSIANEGLDGPLEHWEKIRDTIHAEVCERGFNKKLKSFTQYYDSELLDASLLMIPIVGFLPPDDERVQQTMAAVERTLMHEGIVYRYQSQPHVDGLPKGEGTFFLCSYWYVDNLVLQGRQKEAVEMFERLLTYRNDVGLLGEECDPISRRMLGNFPQAFSHVGLVNSAHNLGRGEHPVEHRSAAPPTDMEPA